MSSSFPCVGSRVIDSEGFKATVRYIGPVAGAKNKEEVWLGVEWDNASRGKHDGSSADSSGVLHKYFECVPGSGSFIKPTKVTYGRTFVEALNDRYVGLDAPTIAESDATLPNAFVSTSKGKQKSIEFVGEDKIRKRQQVANVSSVAVRNDTICTMGDGLGALASHLQEIDLQDNLIWQWSELSVLGMEVPNLCVLLLHGNKLEPITPEIILRLPSGCFSQLRVLALNSCGIKSWSSMQLLEPHLPALVELYLSNNKLSDLPRAKAEKAYQDATGSAPSDLIIVSGFAQLRVLDISGCELEEWSQVAAFRHLPALQELLLDGNPLLREVLPPAEDGDFCHLQRFSLSSTGISTWKDVNILALYPNLRTLRLSQIPLFVGRGSSEVRPEVIARIAQLAFFNGSQISPRERAEAEKNYCRLVMFTTMSIVNKLSNSTSNGIQVTPAAVATGEGVDKELHPRFMELMSRYGADLAPATQTSTAGPINLAAELVSVTFRNLSFGSNGSLEPVTKKLPRSLLISKLQIMVKQLFGLDPRLQQLSMRVHKDAPPTLLDDEKSSLQYYGVVEGADIFINEAKG